jgi:hypothetical protein
VHAERYHTLSLVPLNIAALKAKLAVCISNIQEVREEQQELDEQAQQSGRQVSGYCYAVQVVWTVVCNVSGNHGCKPRMTVFGWGVLLKHFFCRLLLQSWIELTPSALMRSGNAVCVHCPNPAF